MKMRWRVLVVIGLMSSYAFANLEGMVTQEEGGRWPNAEIPYVIDNALPEKNRVALAEAMALWQNETLIHFVKMTPYNQMLYPDYVIFKPAPGKTCDSFVGRQGGAQVVLLAPRCRTMLSAHELGHLIGLWHEQSRSDRDAYVDILWENIREEHYSNFYRRDDEGRHEGAYDYDSIMHYSGKAFSKNGRPTIIPRAKCAKIGQRDHLSQGDIAAVNTLYSMGNYTK
ncbi:MAG: M12 family metallopeptidase [Legionellaceae bacterium]|nr:M12 family metallopeptidase [Legionellaceae bacterium]